MIGLLGSYTSMLGERMCTGLTNTIMQDNEEPGVFDGRLLASNSDFLVTDTGDFLEYIEYR